MTDDIVTRLRDWANRLYPMKYGACMEQAADEIEDLRKAIYAISSLAREHYKSGILWGAINHAVDVADEHYKNCSCGELE